jgi:hypothetical protein
MLHLIKNQIFIEMKKVEKSASAEKSVKKVQENPMQAKALPKTEKKEEKKIVPVVDPEKEKKIEQAKAQVTKLESEFADAKSKLADAKKALKALTGSSKRESKGPGVIASILTIVTNSGKKGISKKEILDRLVELFPDHATDGMEKTIAVQLPGRMSKERNVKIEKLENGNYVFAGKA